MSADTKYLKQRPDGLWLVQVAVPRALRKKLGKVLIEKSLRTAGKAVAIRRRDEVLPIILRGFERAAAGEPHDPEFSMVNVLIEFDVAPHKIVFDDVVKLAHAGETKLAEAVAIKLIKQKQLEPDEAEFSAGDEPKFWRRGRRVVMNANGQWKPLKVSRDTKKASRAKV